MNVLLISECSGNALNETRRIIDQFAERRGERTWQTAITRDGLAALRGLLRKTARKNTAVACHWIRGKDHSELLWVVGDLSRFNDEGTVPTNTTIRDVLRTKDENNWHQAEDIRLLSEMAALFHDFGKSNDAFQEKLREACGPEKASSRSGVRDAFRHEWVSLRIFEALVGDAKTDREWLEKLLNLSGDTEATILRQMKKDGETEGDRYPFNSFVTSAAKSLPVAKAVAWLILTHHRLPVSKEFPNNKTRLSRILLEVDHTWNAPAVSDTGARRRTWTFSKGTPLRSLTWSRAVMKVAKKMQDRPGLLDKADWLEDPFVAHLSRLILMMSDHAYSSQPSSDKYGDQGFPLHANTRDEVLNQRLDEHLIGVGKNIGGVLRDLMRMKDQLLPTLGRHKGFRKRSHGEKYAWQNRACDLVESIRQRTESQGFFGVNMASTGCGKTRANGRIMYALRGAGNSARFSLALGLRTLTLQTGGVYRKQFNLDSDSLAVLVGSGVPPNIIDEPAGGVSPGSESADYLRFEEQSFVHYDGCIADGTLKKWLAKNRDAQKLLSAPVLACTIDHLVPATEGTRGGQQIAPMLRLMSSDLVLDEVDDFGIEDLHAVTRLVNWAGLLGSRVLLSSATLPPSMVQGLFVAYMKGREAYWKNCGDLGEKPPVCCTWFDEFGTEARDVEDGERFLGVHRAFATTRVQNIAKQEIRRKAIVSRPVLDGPGDLYIRVAEGIWNSIQELHNDHHVVDPETGKRVSIGLVRMANIDPLVGVAKSLFGRDAPENIRFHLCCYHARYPLGVRAYTEQNLDLVLNRSGSSPEKDSIFSQKIIQRALAQGDEADHIFVVLASPVAEVGRDHDYDWAVVEPSSMRSIIQLAGRVRRHREGVAVHPNIHLMEKNIRELKGRKIVFHRPGFESEDSPLAEHGLNELVTAEQLHVDSRPRVLEASPLNWSTRLADLEHYRLAEFFGAEVVRWWETPGHLTGVFQWKYRFRKGLPTKPYYFDPREDKGRGFYFVAPDGRGVSMQSLLKWEEVKECGQRVEPWCVPWDAGELLGILEGISDKLELDMNRTVCRFGAIELPDYGDRDMDWCYHPALGVFRGGG